MGLLAKTKVLYEASLARSIEVIQTFAACDKQLVVAVIATANADDANDEYIVMNIVGQAVARLAQLDLIDVPLAWSLAAGT
jgi:hypothetical protein